jgi:hypothetical protein
LTGSTTFLGVLVAVLSVVFAALTIADAATVTTHSGLF